MTLDWEKVIADLWEPIQEVVFPCIGALGWSDQLVDECEGENVFELHDVRPRLASGCILELHGAWFFLTAGHVLDDLQRDRDMGRAQFRFELHHSVRSGTHSKTPFPFDETRHFSLFRSSGLDYGLIPISEPIASRLKTSGVRCVPADMVAGPEEAFDGYILIGFASEEFKTVSVKDTPQRRDVEVFIGVPALPVAAVTGDAIPARFRTDNPFVGRILNMRGRYATGTSVRLESIGGMSGAPIIGFRFRDGSLELRLIAVQSHWIKSKRIIAASRLIYLLAALANAVAQHNDHADEQ